MQSVCHFCCGKNETEQPDLSPPSKYPFGHFSGERKRPKTVRLDKSAKAAKRPVSLPASNACVRTHAKKCPFRPPASTDIFCLLGSVPSPRMCLRHSYAISLKSLKKVAVSAAYFVFSCVDFSLVSIPRICSIFAFAVSSSRISSRLFLYSE